MPMGGRSKECRYFTFRDCKPHVSEYIDHIDISHFKGDP